MKDIKYIQNDIKERIKEYLDTNYDIDVSYMSDYSGIGMDDTTCISIVGDFNTCMSVIAGVISDYVRDMIDTEKYDSPNTEDFDRFVHCILGFSKANISILYWPNIT